MVAFRFGTAVHGNRSKDMNAKPHDAAITSRGNAESQEPILVTGSPPRRFLSIWGGTILMILVFAAGVMGLAGLSVHVAPRTHEVEPANQPGAGIIVRTDLLCLWLPQELTELSKRQSQSLVVRTHEDLQRFLELQDRRQLWYALTFRGHQLNGKVVDLTFIRRPYDDPRHFPEFLNILATAAGNPPRDPDADYSQASISIIAQEGTKREPHAVMAELVNGAFAN
jgi:hypothetical protein